MENLKTTLEILFSMNRRLLGGGYDNALEFINNLIGLEMVEIPSGTQFGTWTVPEEWVVKEAWVKYKDKKIIDYDKERLSLVDYSLPFKGMVTREELSRHLHYSDELPDATPYVFKFYDRNWGFCIPKNQVKIREVEGCEDCEPELKAFDPEVGKIQIQGDKPKETIKDRLKEGEYEVLIDTEFRPGKMKLGIHTITGKKDREILLFAHLDHPFQANDNLSGVVCLLGLATKLKTDHTIKIIFCPETIGSQAYAYTQDLSKVDFVIAVDICGNDNTILLQKAWDLEHRVNRVAHCAFQIMAKPYRKARFRNTIGSDETVFNDPQIGIPGLMFSTWPYKEYHTNWDTPDKINYEKIEEMSNLLIKIIEIWERDYIPKRNFNGPLMRSRYGLQSISKQINLNFDYFFYSIDGKRSLAELCCDFELNFDTMYETLKKIEDDGQLMRIDTGQGPIKPSAKQKYPGFSRQADVSGKRGKVSKHIK